jgi:hypothetical protein
MVLWQWLALVIFVLSSWGMLQCLTTIMHKHGWYWTEEGALNANKEKWE